jgi:hypothetical protein
VEVFTVMDSASSTIDSPIQVVQMNLDGGIMSINQYYRKGEVYGNKDKQLLKLPYPWGN